MLDCERVTASMLSQSVRICHHMESQQTVRQEGEFLWSVWDWSVYPFDSLRQSTAVHRQSQRGVAKQANLPYLSVSTLLKHSRRLRGHAGGPKPCLMPLLLLPSSISILALWGGNGNKKRWMAWAVGGGGTHRELRGDVAGFFSACHFQAVWSVRAGSQAGFCWHVGDLQLSAGEICTAESAGRREESWSWGRRAWRDWGKTGQVAW